MKKILLATLAIIIILPALVSAQVGNTASSCVSITHNIQYGSRDISTGGDVSTLQNFLQKQGYLNSAPTGYLGSLTVVAVNKFQRANGISAVGSVGPLTRAKIKSVSCLSTAATSILPKPANSAVPACLNGVGSLLPGQTYCSNLAIPTLTQNYNLGTISIRAIVANIDEAVNELGPSGVKFTQSKLAEVDQVLQKLNTFVQQSSYGKTKLQWKTSGVYELGNGVCNHASYGDKIDDLTQRALQAADSETPLADYSYFIIVNPMPYCPDGEQWTMEGRTFMTYTLNGRTVHLRGIRDMYELSDEYIFYLFHEFGHTLAYQPNTGIGHPDYLNCPVATSGSEIKIGLSSTCPHVYDWYSQATPVFTIMSNKLGMLSDYNAVEKEIVGWLTNLNTVTTTAGQYTLTPLEQTGSSPKALKIPVIGTNYTVYVSFRQPVGYTYPNAPTNKPNGVILDIVDSNNNEHFLVTNNSNMDAPLQVGVSYRIGTNGPVIRVNSISNNLASITVSSGSTILPPITPPVIPPVATSPSCTLTSNKSSYNYGENIIFSWTSKNTSYASWQQDISGKDHLNLPIDKLSVNGSQSVIANVIGSLSVTLSVAGLNSGTGLGTCSKTVNIVSPTVITPTANIDQGSLTSSSGMPTISGSASNVSQLGISISNSGGKVWASGNFAVSGGRWSRNISQTLMPGAYQVQVYSNSIVLTTGILTITPPAPTCTLTPSSSNQVMSYAPAHFYVKPYTSMTLTWSSRNADYAVVDGEKQNPSGRLTYDNLTAVTNNYDATFYGKGGSTTCNVTVYVDYKG